MAKHFRLYLQELIYVWDHLSQTPCLIHYITLENRSQSNCQLYVKKERGLDERQQPENPPNPEMCLLLIFYDMQVKSRPFFSPHCRGQRLK